MRSKAILWGCLAAGMLSLAGCYHEKYHVKVKHPEDFVVPPNDPRFDEPPEEDYRKPPAKKKDSGGGAPGGGPTSMNAMGRQ